MSKVEGDGSLDRGKPRKTLSEEIRDLEELKCSKEHAKVRHVWKWNSVFLKVFL